MDNLIENIKTLMTADEARNLKVDIKNIEEEKKTIISLNKIINDQIRPAAEKGCRKIYIIEDGLNVFLSPEVMAALTLLGYEIRNNTISW
ncbi:MAG: hypothetical protein WC523_03885 [Patescibacteria group bacterium]